MIAYINIIGAGNADDPALFRLYVEQASNLRRRVRHHHDPKYRTNHPSLQYYIIDCCNRPLKTICFAFIPRHWRLSNDILELVLNILEKLGTLLFQTLPAKTLHQFEIVPTPAETRPPQLTQPPRGSGILGNRFIRNLGEHRSDSVLRDLGTQAGSSLQDHENSHQNVDEGRPQISIQSGKSSDVLGVSLMAERQEFGVG